MSQEKTISVRRLYIRLSDLGVPAARGIHRAFSHNDVEYVLRCQDISNAELPRAIEECLTRGILEKKGESYHVTQSGLAAFDADPRRI